MSSDFKLIVYVKRGKNRKKIFLAIDQPLMPSEIVKKVFNKSSNTNFNIVSRSLNELVRINLVEILNPEEKTGRHYQLTTKGKNIRKELYREGSN